MLRWKRVAYLTQCKYQFPSLKPIAGQAKSSKLQNGRANVLSVKKKKEKNACLSLTKERDAAGHTIWGLREGNVDRFAVNFQV